MIWKYKTILIWSKEKYNFFYIFLKLFLKHKKKNFSQQLWSGGFPLLAFHATQTQVSFFNQSIFVQIIIPLRRWISNGLMSTSVKKSPLRPLSFIITLFRNLHFVWLRAFMLLLRVSFAVVLSLICRLSTNAACCLFDFPVVFFFQSAKLFLDIPGIVKLNILMYW
jgi:hypothetical protein